MKKILIGSIVLIAALVLIIRGRDFVPQSNEISFDQQPDSTIGDFLTIYFDDNYLIKDSLVFDFGDDKQGVLITMFKADEEEVEFKRFDDEPVKRWFFLFSETLEDYKLVFKSGDILPSLGFGERFMTGYHKLTAKNDTIDFYTAIYPSTSSYDYEFHYLFRYDPSVDYWLLFKCEVEKYLNDDLIKDYSLDASVFGTIKMEEFNIYEFNPFVLL